MSLGFLIFKYSSLTFKMIFFTKELNCKVNDFVYICVYSLISGVTSFLSELVM